MTPSRVRSFLLSAVAVAIGASLIVGSVGARRDPPADIDISGAKIHVEFNGDPFGSDRKAILEWIQNAARAVFTYYGRFPVQKLSLRVSSFRGRGAHSGVTYGRPQGGAIRIFAGLASSARDFQNDWELTHEMVHLSFPSVSDDHHWIEEGIATYVEPWARVQAGGLTPEKVWSDLVRDMPKGLPEAGDRGLDRTHTWGRTYWGGALFCLVADVRIREATKNKKGLQDALRGILEAGGSISNDWDFIDALKTGDEATHTSVLTDLYNEWKQTPVEVDLKDLWKRLGIEVSGRDVRLIQTAPLSSARQAIERGK